MAHELGRFGGSVFGPDHELEREGACAVAVEPLVHLGGQPPQKVLRLSILFEADAVIDLRRHRLPLLAEAQRPVIFASTMAASQQFTIQYCFPDERGFIVQPYFSVLKVAL